MIELGPATNWQVILAFLKAEADSSRFADTVLEYIRRMGYSREQLIDQADLKDEPQNRARQRILEAYRGFGQNQYLFRGFPADAAWTRVEIQAADHSRLKYANEPTWVKHSDDTRLVTRLAEKALRGEIPSGLLNHVEGIQRALTSGKTMSELIIAEGPENTLILIEGHARATAYVSLGWKENISAFLASSATMHLWYYY